MAQAFLEKTARFHVLKIKKNRTNAYRRDSQTEKGRAFISDERVTPHGQTNPQKNAPTLRFKGGV